MRSNPLMNPATLLRIAAGLALLQFAAHTAMFVTYVPKHGADEVAVVEAMRSHYFSFSGNMRSYWDMYFGYGLFAAFNCLIEAVLFWLLADLAKASPRAIRPAAALFLLANLGYLALIHTYFFPLPGYFDALLALLMAWVIFAASRSPASR